MASLVPTESTPPPDVSSVESLQRNPEVSIKESVAALQELHEANPAKKGSIFIKMGEVYDELDDFAHRAEQEGRGDEATGLRRWQHELLSARMSYVAHELPAAPRGADEDPPTLARVRRGAEQLDEKRKRQEKKDKAEAKGDRRKRALKRVFFSAIAKDIEKLQRDRPEYFLDETTEEALTRMANQGSSHSNVSRLERRVTEIREQAAELVEEHSYNRDEIQLIIIQSLDEVPDDAVIPPVEKFAADTNVYEPEELEEAAMVDYFNRNQANIGEVRGLVDAVETELTGARRALYEDGELPACRRDALNNFAATTGRTIVEDNGRLAEFNQEAERLTTTDPSRALQLVHEDFAGRIANQPALSRIDNRRLEVLYTMLNGVEARIRGERDSDDLRFDPTYQRVVLWRSEVEKEWIRINGVAVEAAPRGERQPAPPIDRVMTVAERVRGEVDQRLALDMATDTIEGERELTGQIIPDTLATRYKILTEVLREEVEENNYHRDLVNAVIVEVAGPNMNDRATLNVEMYLTERGYTNLGPAYRNPLELAMAVARREIGHHVDENPEIAAILQQVGEGITPLREQYNLLLQDLPEGEYRDYLERRLATIDDLEQVYTGDQIQVEVRGLLGRRSRERLKEERKRREEQRITTGQPENLERVEQTKVAASQYGEGVPRGKRRATKTERTPRALWKDKVRVVEVSDQEKLAQLEIEARMAERDARVAKRAESGPEAKESKPVIKDFEHRILKEYVTELAETLYDQSSSGPGGRRRREADEVRQIIVNSIANSEPTTLYYLDPLLFDIAYNEQGIIPPRDVSDTVQTLIRGGRLNPETIANRIVTNLNRRQATFTIAATKRSTIDGGRIDADEQDIWRERMSNRLRLARERNLEVAPNLIAIFNEMNDEMLSTPEEMQEFVFALRRYGPTENRLYVPNFETFYDHGQLFGTDVQTNMERAYMYVYDLAEEILRRGFNMNIGLEPVTGINDRPTRDQELIFEQMRHFLDDERRRLRGLADPDTTPNNDPRLKVFNELDRSIIARQYGAVGRQLNDAPYEPRLRSMYREVRDAMRLRGIWIPDVSLRGAGDLIRRRGDIEDEVRGIVPAIEGAGPILPEDLVKTVKRFLTEYSSLSTNPGSGRTVYARERMIRENANRIQRIPYGDQLDLAHLIYVRYHNVNARNLYGVEPNLEYIMVEVADEYGLAADEIGEIGRILMDEHLPEVGRLYNWHEANVLRRKNENIIQVLMDQAEARVRGRTVEERIPRYEAFGRLTGMTTEHRDMTDPERREAQYDAVYNEVLLIDRGGVTPEHRARLNQVEGIFLQQYLPELQGQLERAIAGGSSTKLISSRIREVRRALRALGVQVRPPRIVGRGRMLQRVVENKKQRKKLEAGAPPPADRRMTFQEIVHLGLIAAQRVRGARRYARQRGYVAEGEDINFNGIMAELAEEFTLTPEEQTRVRYFAGIRQDRLRGYLEGVGVSGLLHIEGQIRERNSELFGQQGHTLAARNVADYLLDFIALDLGMPLYQIGGEGRQRAVALALRHINDQIAGREARAESSTDLQGVKVQLLQLQEAAARTPTAQTNVGLNEILAQADINDPQLNAQLVERLGEDIARRLRIQNVSLHLMHENDFQRVYQEMNAFLNDRMEGLNVQQQQPYYVLLSHLENLIDIRRRNRAA
ncbi:MAG: hypothetical protein ACE5DX_05495 [Candidatus Dojkabacteria bacterium]